MKSNERTDFNIVEIVRKDDTIHIDVSNLVGLVRIDERTEIKLIFNNCDKIMLFGDSSELRIAERLILEQLNNYRIHQSEQLLQNKILLDGVSKLNETLNAHEMKIDKLIKDVETRIIRDLGKSLQDRIECTVHHISNNITELEDKLNEMNDSLDSFELCMEY